MSMFDKYKLKRPAEFTRLVGVNFGTFAVILEKLKNEIARYRQAKLVRRRGAPSSFALEDQLLLTLLYLRQHHTFLQLAEMFSISESYAQKRYTFITRRLLKALDIPNDKMLTADNLKLIADVTEQPVERPLKEQKSYYSGKKTSYLESLVDRLFSDGNDSRGALCARHQTRFQDFEGKWFENQQECPNQSR
jgi:hypothetical protein